MTTHNTCERLSSRRLVPFLIGTALGNAGDLFTQIAVLWTGLSITRTALPIAGLGGVWTLGAAFAGLASGPIVDRINRRNMLIYLHGLLALLCSAIFAFSRTGTLQMRHLWFFLTGEAVFGTPVTAAFSAILPNIVPKDRLVRVNGLLSSWGMADNLIEAALSGVILALWAPLPSSCSTVLRTWLKLPPRCSCRNTPARLTRIKTNPLGTRFMIFGVPSDTLLARDCSGG